MKIYFFIKNVKCLTPIYPCFELSFEKSVLIGCRHGIRNQPAKFQVCWL